MDWIKKGLIYSPDGSMPWAKTHAYCPTIYKRKNGDTRIYFSSWDENCKGSIGYADIEFENEKPIITSIAKQPVLSPGIPGAFDCDGVAPSQVVQEGDKLYMFYFGFQRTVSGINLILAGVVQSSDDGDTFERVINTPFLDRTETEYFFRSSLFFFENNLFYTGSIEDNCSISSPLYKNKLFPKYTIKRLFNSYRKNYTSYNSSIAIPLQNDEFGICRPWIIKFDDGLRMWYSKRTLSCNYRICCAISYDNGITWKKESSGITVSDEGWDSEMICFASIDNIDGKLCMVYNGNKHGKDGFGIAISDKGI